MRVTAEIPRKSAGADKLIEDIRALGLNPIVTPYVVRTVYEGTSLQLGEAIINRFELEPDHGIVSDYNKDEQEAKKRAERRRR